MNRLGRRIEMLEQAFGLGIEQAPPLSIKVQYVAPDGEVTEGYVVEVGQPAAPLQTASKSRRA